MNYDNYRHTPLEIWLSISSTTRLAHSWQHSFTNKCSDQALFIHLSQLIFYAIQLKNVAKRAASCRYNLGRHVIFLYFLDFISIHSLYAGTFATLIEYRSIKAENRMILLQNDHLIIVLKPSNRGCRIKLLKWTL